MKTRKETLHKLVAAMSAGNSQLAMDLMDDLDADFDLDAPISAADDLLEYQGMALVHVAVRFGLGDVIIYLYEIKADVNQVTTGSPRDKEDGLTPLHAAVYYDQPLIIENLARCRAAMDADTANNMSPVHLAASLGRDQVLTQLISHDADYTSPIKKGKMAGMTPLLLATLSERVSTVRLLIDEGVAFNRAVEQAGKMVVARNITESIRKKSPAVGKELISILDEAEAFFKISEEYIRDTTGVNTQWACKSGKL